MQTVGIVIGIVTVCIVQFYLARRGRVWSLIIPAIIIGAGEQDVHTTKEHITVEDMAKSTELIHAIIHNASAYKVDANDQIVPRG